MPTRVRSRPSDSKPSSGNEFELIGGHVVLDFCNTVAGRRGHDAEDLLASYRDLLAWGQAAGLLARGDARSLASWAERHEGPARSSLERAVSLREALYGALHEIAAGRRPGSADLDQIGRTFGDATSAGRMVWTPDGCEWSWSDRAAAADVVSWHVATRASELLCSGLLARVRECASPTCGWLFLDTTRNGSRRWCEMKVCGNRAKVRRYRSRHAGR